MRRSSERGYPSRQERLPSDRSAVSPQWLSRMLNNRYPGLVVRDLKILQTIEGHTTKLRIEVDIDQPAGQVAIPKNLCLKSNWSASPLSGDVNANEARFYKELAGELGLPAAACYYADWDDDEAGQQGLMALEDLTLRGGRFGGTIPALSLDGAAKGLESLAALHGSTWGDARLDAASWLQTAMSPETPWDDYWSMMEDYFYRHMRLPERVAIFPKWMAEEPDRLRTAFRQLCAYDTQKPGPRCLVHGDAHLGNSYVLPDGQLLWLDWQIVRKGRPWRDYSYFLVGAISVEDRRKGERDLLRHYLEQLAKYGVSIGMEEAWDEYRRWVVWGLIGWQSNINPLHDTMVPLDRMCRAAEDLKIHEFYRF